MGVRCLSTDSLAEVRYWYLSIQNYIAYHDKSLLGWSYSSRSIKMGTDTEAKLLSLTGIPTLEQLYISSCLSHYHHIERMVELNIDGLGTSGVVRKHPRKKRLIYCAHEAKGRVSPLRLLIANANNCKGMSRVTPRISDAFLVKVESELYKLTRNDVRDMQKILSLSFFGRLDEKSKRSCPPLDTLSKYQPQFKRLRRMLRKHDAQSSIRLQDPYGQLPIFKPM